MIVESVIHRLLVENTSHHKEICSCIAKLRKALKRKDFVVQVSFKMPSPTKEYSNYGTLDICIDMERGRGGKMTQRAIATQVKHAMEKCGLNKFFKPHGVSYDGDKTEISCLLNDRYVEKYMGIGQPDEVVETKTESLKEHFDTSKFPEPGGLGFEEPMYYTYKGHSIDFVKLNGGWKAKINPRLNSLDKPGVIFGLSKQDLLNVIKKYADLSQMPKEIQDAFLQVYDMTSDLDNPTRESLAHYIESWTKQYNQYNHSPFHKLTVEQRIKILDEVIDLINSENY